MLILCVNVPHVSVHCKVTSDHAQHYQLQGRNLEPSYRADQGPPTLFVTPDFHGIQMSDT